MFHVLSDARRLAAVAASFPLRRLFGAVHRARTPDRAVLEVTIEPLGTNLARERMLSSLRLVADDARVEGVLLVIRGSPGGRASAQDLREAIRGLRDAGKGVWAWLDHPTDLTLWIAAACEQVFVMPTAVVDLLGAGGEMTFFGQALERIGVHAEVVAAGAYKSAGEPFVRSFASPQNLEATHALLADLQAQVADDLAADRRLDAGTLADLYARAPLAAEDAVVAGLVDKLLYRDQVLGQLERERGEGLKRYAFEDWANRAGRLARLSAWGAPSRAVVVVHLDGAIVPRDERLHNRIRADAVATLLDELREDDDVGAVVLHVDSPGGDVIASDALWREVERLREVKPVVASFADVSASGGVYLTASATEVFARPATITGSIGVFAFKPAVGEALRRIGVTTQPVRAAPNATLYSASQAFTDAQRHRLRARLQGWYDGFVHRVASGRGRADEAIEPHCQGRVWTGRMAIERGLVDRLGTLSDAVRRAKVLAGLPGDAPRRDVDGQPDLGPLMNRLRDRLRSSPLPVGASAGALGDALVRGLTGAPSELVGLLVEQQGRAMALLPYVVDDR